MSNLLKQYGIKEVADVTFYSITDTGTKGAPILFLDSLKISTIEQSAEEALAQGGKGNGTFIAWDYGREITMSIEDALFSPKSMALIMGDGEVDETTVTGLTKMVRAGSPDIPSEGVTTGWKIAEIDVEGVNKTDVYDAAMNSDPGATDYAYAKLIPTSTTAAAKKININANSFPGVYYVTGDTYARDRDGKDQGFQIVIPRAKLMIDNSITLEADGDPAVFNMGLKVLRPTTGPMMSLVQYEQN